MRTALFLAPLFALAGCDLAPEAGFSGQEYNTLARGQMVTGVCGSGELFARNGTATRGFIIDLPEILEIADAVDGLFIDGLKLRIALDLPDHQDLITAFAGEGLNAGGCAAVLNPGRRGGVDERFTAVDGSIMISIDLLTADLLSFDVQARDLTFRNARGESFQLQRLNMGGMESGMGRYGLDGMLDLFNFIQLDLVDNLITVIDRQNLLNELLDEVLAVLGNGDRDSDLFGGALDDLLGPILGDGGLLGSDLGTALDDILGGGLDGLLDLDNNGILDDLLGQGLQDGVLNDLLDGLISDLLGGDDESGDENVPGVEGLVDDVVDAITGGEDDETVVDRVLDLILGEDRNTDVDAGGEEGEEGDDSEEDDDLLGGLLDNLLGGLF